jgi:hypothetical protein
MTAHFQTVQTNLSNHPFWNETAALRKKRVSGGLKTWTLSPLFVPAPSTFPIQAALLPMPLQMDANQDCKSRTKSGRFARFS